MSLHRSTIKIQGESQGLVLYLNKIFLDNHKPTVPLDQQSGGLVMFGVHDLMHPRCYQERYCFRISKMLPLTIFCSPSKGPA